MNIRNIDEAIEILYRLNVGVIGSGENRHERPHKAVLLLAVLDLIAAGRASADRVPWSQELRERFTAYFEVVRRNDDQNTPENPFYYLKGDEFWEPLESQDGTERALANTPTVAQAKAGNVFARVTGGLEALLRTPEQRAKLRTALVSRYFPTTRPLLTPLFIEPGAAPAEEGETPILAAARRMRVMTPRPVEIRHSGESCWRLMTFSAPHADCASSCPKPT